MQGINVEYSLDPYYFKVGCAYELNLGSNKYRVGLLSDFSNEAVTFKILENGEITDLTLTIDQLRFTSYEIVRMEPDYVNGSFSSE